MEFSDDQRKAVDAVEAWKSGGAQTLTLGGYAGTGKSTLVSHFAGEWSNVAVCALCGKAADVLRRKGVGQAQTAHSLIYHVEGKGRNLRFRRRAFIDCSVVIVDEASMFNRQLYDDLLSFRKPVLFVGDYGQLEPIGDNPGLMVNPQIRLETIHRQAQDNPILRLATAFRQGRPTPHWSDSRGRLEVLPSASFTQLVRPGVQIICGFNRTRHSVNRMVREQLGVARHVVVHGETLVCLKNNSDYGIFNGQMFHVEQVHHTTKTYADLTLIDDDGDRLSIPALVEQFGADPIKDRNIKHYGLFDYGYCLTAHKSQGSDFTEVLALDEVGALWDPRRWRYTVATRAEEKLTYCID